MVPENILWAFFSPVHYEQMRAEAEVRGRPTPKDVYYKDFNGKWVKVTATFECIEKGKMNYRYNDSIYLGGVKADSKGEVARGGVFPPPPVEDKPVKAEQPVKKKKKVSSKQPGAPVTITVQKKRDFDPFTDYYSNYGYKKNYWDDLNV